MALPKKQKTPQSEIKHAKDLKKNLRTTTMTTIKFDDFLENELADNNFKEGFLTEKAILESAIAVSDARQTAGLTQRELASLSHVPQSTIARIERGHNTSIETMSKIALALNKNLTIKIS